MGGKVFLIVAAAVSVLIITAWVIKAERGGVSFMKSALEGVAAMFAVNLIGTVTGVAVAVNWYTIGTALICGLPGVIALLALRFIMHT